MSPEDARHGATRPDDNITPLLPSRGSEDPRSRHPSHTGHEAPPERDPFGKMALFSGERPQPLLGTLLVDCSSCRRETPVSPVQLIRSAFPLSVHLPLVRKYHSFVRCPACGRRTWVRFRWQP